MSGTASIGQPARADWIRAALGIGIPLSWIAIGYALWWISDRLLVIGPLDRAAFGWAVVVPIWLAAPEVAGIAWRALDRRVLVGTTIVVTLVVAGIAAWLWWSVTAYPDCQYGTTQTPAGWLISSVALGIGVGAGLAAGGLSSRQLIRMRHPLWALPAGAVMQLVVLLLGSSLAATALMGGCRRMPI